jgi:hypothetical protein
LVEVQAETISIGGETRTIRARAIIGSACAGGVVGVGSGPTTVGSGNKSLARDCQSGRTGERESIAWTSTSRSEVAGEGACVANLTKGTTTYVKAKLVRISLS